MEVQEGRWNRKGIVEKKLIGEVESSKGNEDWGIVG
jgi:hypothetical protein